MRNFQKKKNMWSLLYSKPVLVFLGIILVLFTYNLLGLLGKMRETVKNKENAQNRLEELSANKERLTQHIAQLETEEGIEENIREKFGLVKEGEGVIIVVEDKAEAKINMEANSGGLLNFIKNIFR